MNTRRWFKGIISTWFSGKNIREALNKFYEWIDYMDEAGYGIHTISISYGDNQLLVVYSLNDKFR